jgi:hypothetical protein
MGSLREKILMGASIAVAGLCIYVVSNDYQKKDIAEEQQTTTIEERVDYGNHRVNLTGTSQQRAETENNYQNVNTNELTQGILMLAREMERQKETNRLWERTEEIETFVKESLQDYKVAISQCQINETNPNEETLITYLQNNEVSLFRNYLIGVQTETAGGFSIIVPDLPNFQYNFENIEELPLAVEAVNRKIYLQTYSYNYQW